MSIPGNLSVTGRKNSLSSISSSSMESLSSHDADSCCSNDRELTNAYTVLPLRVKTSDYDTSEAEYTDEDMKHCNKSAVKAACLNRLTKLRKATSVNNQNPPDAAELMARLSLLEEHMRTMREELHKERVHREELEKKVDNLQSENEQLKSEQKIAGDQLRKFCKNFFDSINSIPSHLMHNDGISTSSLYRSSDLSRNTSEQVSIP